MMVFLLKSSLAMAFFWALYYLLLRKEKAFVFNRFYLLFVPFASLYFPFWISRINVLEAPIMNVEEKGAHFAFLFPQKVVADASRLLWEDVLWGLYIMGIIIMLMVFFLNLWKMHKKIKSGSCIPTATHRWLLHKENLPPFSFFHYIFLHEGDFGNRNKEALLIKHELVHVRQKHSIDLLLVEFLHAFFWFNPILILYKKSIRLNHEFLADHAVVSTLEDPASYLKLMIQKFGNPSPASFASPLASGFAKQRFRMIFTSNKKFMKMLKQVFTLILFCAFFQLFGKVEYQIQRPQNIESNVGEYKETKDSDPFVSNFQDPKVHYDLNTEEGGMMIYVFVEGKKGRYILGGVSGNVKVRFTNAAGKRISKTCKDLTQEERAWFWKLEKSEAESFQAMPPSKKPSESQWNDFLNSNKYGLWLNGKRTPNKELQNYSLDDIHQYGMSRLMKNAAHYGQYTYHLSVDTKDYIAKQYPGKDRGYWTPLHVREGDYYEKHFKRK